MNRDESAVAVMERAELEDTVLHRRLLEEQFHDLDHQHATAALGMWVFLVTEVLFFGALFFGVAAYHVLYPEAFEKGSEALNWMVGSINTVVLLVSSLFMVLSVHYAREGDRRRLMRYLLLTAALGVVFLCFKAFEYYTDYRDNLIPGWKFDDAEWTAKGVRPAEVKLFLLFYWFMTGLHALHVTIGVVVVLVMYFMARAGAFSPLYYTPVDVTALYWHFVDLVWIFLLPMLYLLGTHTLADLHIL